MSRLRGDLQLFVADPPLWSFLKIATRYTWAAGQTGASVPTWSVAPPAFCLTSVIHYYNTDTVMTDLIILAMLLEGPQHGYRLKRDAGALFGQAVLHNNLVYPLLRRFTAEGWVTKQTVPGERGQNRQQYAITPLGRRTLLERLSSFAEQDARSEENFRGRVGFFELLPGEARERILGLREDFLTGRDERFAALQKNMELGAYGGEVVIFMRAQIKVELAWIGRLRRLSSKDLSSKQGRKRS